MSPTRKSQLARRLRMTSANANQNDDVLIVDPSYMSGPANILSATRVYVDSLGEEHDPEYRAFPIIDPGRAAKRRRALAKGMTLSQRGSSHYDTDEDEDEDPFNTNHRRSSYISNANNYHNYYSTPMAASSFSSTSSHSSSSQRTSFYASPTQPDRVTRLSARPNRFQVPPPPSTTRSSIDSARRSPSAWRAPREAPQYAQSEDELDEQPSSPSRWRRRFSVGRRPSIEEEDEADGPEQPVYSHYGYRETEHSTRLPHRRLKKRGVVMEEDQEALAERSQAGDAAPNPCQDQEEGAWVPSCTDQLRNRWHLISMRIQFKAYYTKQKLFGKSD